MNLLLILVDHHCTNAELFPIMFDVTECNAKFDERVNREGSKLSNKSFYLLRFYFVRLPVGFQLGKNYVGEAARPEKCHSEMQRNAIL